MEPALSSPTHFDAYYADNPIMQMGSPPFGTGSADHSGHRDPPKSLTRRTSSQGRKKSNETPRSTSPASSSGGFKFIVISDHKEQKSRKFKSNVKRHVMAHHMRQKQEQLLDKQDQWQNYWVDAARTSSGSPVPVQYEPSAEHQPGNNAYAYNMNLCGLVCSFSSQPSEYPFEELFKLENAAIDPVVLDYECSRFLDTDDVKWNIMFSNVLLPTRVSTYCIVSSCLDLVNGSTCDSSRTISLRYEGMQYLRNRLENRVHQDDPGLGLITIGLISSELLSMNIENDAGSTHVTGLLQMTESTGGLTAMNKQNGYANYITSAVFTYYIEFEALPPPSFLNFVPLRGCMSTNRLPDEDSMGSPMEYYIKRGEGLGFLNQLIEQTQSGHLEYLPLRRSRNCSRLSHDLLCDLRHATNLFLGYSSASSPLEETFSASSPEYSRDIIRSYLDRVQRLPSAADPDRWNPAKGDWVYECIRITCLLYFTSLFHNIPLSAANERLSAWGAAPYPSTAFAAALLRTDHANCWGDLSGFLYFCSNIMAAASRPFTLTGDFKDMKARRWNLLAVIKCTAALGYEPLWSILGIQRLLIEVQARLGQTERTLKMPSEVEEEVYKEPMRGAFINFQQRG